MVQGILENLKIGSEFFALGDEFILLDKFALGCFAIRKYIYCFTCFDEKGHNDLRYATIDNKRQEYTDFLTQKQEKKMIRTTDVDLTSTTQNKAYDALRCKSCGMLTLLEYGKYQKIIPNDYQPYWLATPYNTRNDAHEDLEVWAVQPQGGIIPMSPKLELGFRPTVMFASSIMVSVNDPNTFIDEKYFKKDFKGYKEYLLDFIATMDEKCPGEAPIHPYDWMADRS